MIIYYFIDNKMQGQLLETVDFIPNTDAPPLAIIIVKGTNLDYNSTN